MTPATTWLEGRTVVVTGGAGSFGRTVVRTALDRGAAEVRVFSRDEGKHDAMRQAFQEPRLRFVIGDVRDPVRVRDAMVGADTVFHAAALKQVPACEDAPVEAVRTNVLGTQNVVAAAVACGVQRVVALSTDKAVRPINAMGMTKALVEKVVLAKARDLGPDAVTRLTIVRYGNVIASRGSVVPVFLEAVRERRPITVTDPTMTRFLMTLHESVALIQHALAHGLQGDTFVRLSPAGTVADIATAVRNVAGRPDHPITIVGVRPGEKLHESLATGEERARAQHLGEALRIPANGAEQVRSAVGDDADLASDRVERLDVTAIERLIEAQDELRPWLDGGRRVRVDATERTTA